MNRRRLKHVLVALVLAIVIVGIMGAMQLLLFEKPVGTVLEIAARLTVTWAIIMVATFRNWLT